MVSGKSSPEHQPHKGYHRIAGSKNTGVGEGCRDVATETFRDLPPTDEAYMDAPVQATTRSRAGTHD